MEDERADRIGTGVAAASAGDAPSGRNADRISRGANASALSPFSRDPPMGTGAGVDPPSLSLASS